MPTRAAVERDRSWAATLVQFFQDLRAAYPQAERIAVVLDTGPIPIHPDVLVALERPEPRQLRPLPPWWPATPSATARTQWRPRQLPIQLVPLPSSAAWCKPIAKPGTRWVPQAASVPDAAPAGGHRSVPVAGGDRPRRDPVRHRLDRSLTLCRIRNTRLIFRGSLAQGLPKENEKHMKVLFPSENESGN